VHEVELDPFLIGKYEVTQDDWSRVMGTIPPSLEQPDGRRPVQSVSWKECRSFCEKTGLRLPTEAEWEYACRAGTTDPHGGPGKLEDMAWFSDNSDFETHPVGQKAANGFGVHDMLGNVSEWCDTPWLPDYEDYDLHSDQEPEARTLRGGGCNDHLDCLRCAFRDSRGGRIGFRVVASPFSDP
jgi:formylglycine-generating enzyme required for sulfatase activity